MEGQSCGYILRMLVIITDMPMERKVLKYWMISGCRSDISSGGKVPPIRNFLK